MKRNLTILFILLITSSIFTGCLTIEKKEYSFEMTGKNSGKLTIKYVNIMSSEGDSLQAVNADFDELTSSYMMGDKLQNDYPNTTNIQKRLFEENGVLCGEVTMSFPNLAAVKLYQYDTKSPFMLSLGFLDSETFAESNGKHGGDVMPIVFWDKKLKKLTLATNVTKPSEKTLSLLEKYNRWKK